MTLTSASAGVGRFAQFAAPARVIHRVELSSSLVLLSFDPGDTYREFHAGDKIKLAVPGGRPKSYTPGRWGRDGLEVVFELHGLGPTARWASQAQPGAVAWTTQSLPSLRVPAGQLWFVGDATTLGLALSLHEDRRYTLSGVVELGDDDAVAVQRLGLPLTPVSRGEGAHVPPVGADIAVIAGEAGLVSRAHRAMAQAGISTICTKPYWSLKGKAHRKWVALSTGGGQ